MKSTPVLVALLSFAFVILSPHFVFAQTITTDPLQSLSPASVDPSLSTTPVITMENKEIQYDMPYPGILPDNPLYFLKVVRDKVEGFFITDPLQKANFDMEQADKRMNASIYLSEEKSGRDALISSTVSKALNYFEQAITQTKQAQEQGEDVMSFAGHMDIASQKYHQLMLQLETEASSQLHTDIEGDKARIATLHAAVTTIEASKNH